MSALFSAYKLKSVELRNRIAVPPMCQYSAVDGLANDWHLVHYAGLARGGAGLVIVEATGVSPEGRISPACLGLWNNDQAEVLAQVAGLIKAGGAVPGIQIGHAGRKASAELPWQGDGHLAADDPRAWPTLSPSAIAFGANLPRVPREMSLEDIARVQHDFVNAAQRALAAGFEWLELHFAHGYLGQSFFSVHANRREDAYGGDAVRRGRFLLETVRAVRRVWPEHLPLTARFGVLEFDGRDEETLAEAIGLTRAMREEGLDFLNVSMGFSTPEATIPWAPGFLLPVAERVRREAGLPVATSWYLDDPALAERAVAGEQVDLVMIGRALLANPHWPLVAAQELGLERPSAVLPPPYAHWAGRYRSKR
jgi:2,4-dienoyl-CoA reductase-like NADH-dependent reductase (Old Yellow Enzyme family)